ncbi:MAG TPA: DUF1801 domain-containing protein [Dyadobacter sp.]|jgi:uncharacterized protein YdhG (YjbR/CyaY superfamily)|nr:DUF1801 domain-containing protein [Dyadobacter sp.]
MTKVEYKDIDHYHAVFPDEIQQRLQTVRELVHRISPDAKEVISYSIPAFRIDKKFLIYYCAFPKHLTISNPWSQALLAEFESELKGYKISKAAIQFPHNKPLPLDLIERIIKFRKMEVDTAG